MSQNEDIQNIKKLGSMADEILELKNKYRQRRPIVIEFCGSPKSGKTSCINSLNIFLKRNGFRTQILTERASVCPIENKHDPLFNIWTSCASIAELTEKLSLSIDSVDVIIADRGIFDSLCWFNWLKTRNYMDMTNYNSIINFLTSNIWRRYIDIIYVFTATPEISMKREYAILLTRKLGSIMNKKTLVEYRKAIDDTINCLGCKFKKIEKVDTSNSTQNDVSVKVTKTILKILRSLLVEKIGYFKNHSIKADLSYGLNEFSRIEKKAELNFDDRDKVEKSDYIQPIPIAVLTNKSRDKVLILKKQNKSLSEDSPEKRKLLIYAGGHIRKEDNLEGKDEPLVNIARNTLNREIKEELGISIVPNDNVKSFLIYTPNNQISKKHLAICFIIVLDFKNLKLRFDRREIIQKKGITMSGRPVEIINLESKNDEIESWSRIILQEFFNMKLKSQEQLVI